MKLFAVLISICIYQQTWTVVGAQESVERICGRLNEDDISNNAKTTALDEFPWIGRLLYEDDKPLCTAILISAKDLLATAVCVKSAQVPHVVELNAQDEHQTVRHEIEEIVIHPENCFAGNDIAIIILKSEVIFTPQIQPICLPPSGLLNNLVLRNFAGQKLISSGFPLRYSSSNSRQKLKSDVQFVNFEKCNEMFSNMSQKVTIEESHICGTYDSENCPTLQSGSPLMTIARRRGANERKVYLIGPVSFGASTCRSSVPDIFVNVGYHLNWIYKNTAYVFQ